MSYLQKYEYSYASRLVYHILEIEVRNEAETSAVLSIIFFCEFVHFYIFLDHFYFPMSVSMFAAFPYLMAVSTPPLRVEKYVSVETCEKCLNEKHLDR